MSMAKKQPKRYFVKFETEVEAYTEAEAIEKARAHLMLNGQAEVRCEEMEPVRPYKGGW